MQPDEKSPSLVVDLEAVNFFAPAGKKKLCGVGDNCLGRQLTTHALLVHGHHDHPARRPRWDW